MISAADFVADLPEFKDPVAFPPAMVTWWLTFAAKFINQERWGLPGAGGSAERTEFDYGQELYAAHQLTLEARAIAEATNGAQPGLAFGMLNSKSVDKVSVGFDTGSVAELDAGHWNLTIYGMRFKRLADTFGAGPIQVGCGWVPPFSGPAWCGPWVYNFPNPSQ